MIKSSQKSGIVRALVAGLLSSLFLILAFPPFSLWGFSFLIPMPLFAIASYPKCSPSRKAFWSALGSFPGWLWTHAWVSDISALGMIPLVIHLAFYTFLFVWIASHLSNRFGREIIVLPLVWVGIEFFRGSILWTGYPWYFISHPLIDSPLGVLATPATLLGVYFVSYLCASYSIMLLLTISSPTNALRKRAGYIAAIIFALWIGIGYILIPSSPKDSTSIRVGVVQPNVPQDNRLDWTVRQRVRDWHTLRDLTIAAARDPKNPEPLDVIIWPEGFVPGWTLDPLSLTLERSENIAWNMTPRNPTDVPEPLDVPSRIGATTVVDEMLILQANLGIPLIVGSVAYDNLRIVDTDEGIQYERDAMYNSAFVIDHGQPQLIWYDKLHLTPFGEIMPYISTWHWLEQQLLSFGASGMEFALDPGKSARLLTIPITNNPEINVVSVATPICFEATMSRVCRRLVFKRGVRQAGVMINLTNDGWFGTWDAGRKTHLQSARWRCVELNTPMIRSANTGISCVIDHRGRIQTDSITPLDPSDPKEGHLIADVQLAQRGTLYAHFGDIFGWGCFVLMLIGVALTILGQSPRVQSVDTSSA